MRFTRVLRLVVAGIATTLLLAVLPAVSGAAAAATASAPVPGREWKAAINDWFARGELSTAHSCAAAVVARSHVQRSKHLQLARALDKYARRICRSNPDPWVATIGMSNRDVATKAGAPVPGLSGPSCWYYRAKRPETSIVGLDICFDRRGYVARIIRAVHL
jgi:hypothetical protein